jgi:hypothetical protein
LTFTAVFSGVSAAVEYTFPLVLGPRERFFIKLRCREVVPEMSVVPRTVCSDGSRGLDFGEKHKTTWAVREEPAGP